MEKQPPLSAEEMITLDESLRKHKDDDLQRPRKLGDYPSPNTVFLPCIGTTPLIYYSPKRPTRALRFLCWIVGAHLDYLPDRVSFSWNNRNTLPIIDPRIDPEPIFVPPAGPENEQQIESDTGGKSNPRGTRR